MIRRNLPGDPAATTWQAPLAWRRLGPLSACNASTAGGVYLLVHEGKFRRVLYVGTTGNFGQRIASHLAGFLRGNRTIWRVTAGADVYSLATAWHMRNSVRHFKQLAQRDALWGATTIEQLHAKNLLAPEKPFNADWLEFLTTDYLPSICVWTLKLDPYHAREAVLIESAIQQRLVELFRLGRFFNHKDLSILGKIEFNTRRIRIKRPFENVPDLDPASQIVFGSLDAKTIPQEAVALAAKQLFEVIESRLAERKKRSRARKSALAWYPQTGTKWTPMEEEKLRTMLVDFDMTAAEIAGVLGRKPSTVRSHIERCDKFTARTWRNR